MQLSDTIEQEKALREAASRSDATPTELAQRSLQTPEAERIHTLLEATSTELGLRNSQYS